ncbi:hypothetical protein R6Q59_005825 [Mikania micrantha]
MREYRKGNWTLEETLVLIEAKQLESQRRMLNNTIIKPTGELRWKWIEQHCWKNSCFRSQNQCNDKWDNMMRDFKKVRDFERRNCHHHHHHHHHHDRGQDHDDDEQHMNTCYWNMDKIQRKNSNLPSNLLPQVYQALAHVMEAKSGGGGGSSSTVLPTVVIHRETTAPPPPPPVVLPQQESSTKRRRSTEGGRNISEEISSSANELIEAIKGYEEREETRQKELYTMHQKMYKIEESKIESDRQGYNELVDVINNLSNSILAFTSQSAHL